VCDRGNKVLKIQGRTADALALCGDEGRG